MQLLILGGTGFIGPHQIDYALHRGHRVTLFNRGRQRQAWPGPAETLIGDRDGDLQALAGREWDVCIKITLNERDLLYLYQRSLIVTGQEK